VGLAPDAGFAFVLPVACDVSAGARRLIDRITAGGMSADGGLRAT
jgi:hypothetical protein